MPSISGSEEFLSTSLSCSLVSTLAAASANRSRIFLCTVRLGCGRIRKARRRSSASIEYSAVDARKRHGLGSLVGGVLSAVCSLFDFGMTCG
jgi:hypothetical protein